MCTHVQADAEKGKGQTQCRVGWAVGKSSPVDADALCSVAFQVAARGQTIIRLVPKNFIF